MKDEHRSLTLNGMTLPHIILILLAAAIVGVGIYLTKHFFDVHFSQDLTVGAICDVSQFWSCDKATLSPISHFFGVPLSVFGLLYGVFLLNGCIFPSKAMEKTNYFLTILNALGCILLFFYSIIFLKGLCLMCSIYYLLSFIVLFLFFKKGILEARPSGKVLGSYLLVTLLVGGVFSYQVSAKMNRQEEIAKLLIDQFYQLPNIGDPKGESSSKIVMSAEKFEQAPLRLSFFSDFQCPACKMLADTVPKIIERYKGKINIQYFFYPLDQNCNHNLTRQLHPLACEAAYLAVCIPRKFPEVHDSIFENQEELSQEWIQDYAKKNQALECLKDPKTKEAVVKSISVGDEFKVKSTPTIILNGVKISLPPLNQLFLIFDEILRRDGQKVSGK